MRDRCFGRNSVGENIIRGSVEEYVGEEAGGENKQLQLKSRGEGDERRQGGYTVEKGICRPIQQALSEEGDSMPNSWGWGGDSICLDGSDSDSIPSLTQQKHVRNGSAQAASSERTDEKVKEI